MSRFHCAVALTVVTMLAGRNLAAGADKVLVAGDPQLTQEAVDLYRDMWEWYCDVKLTGEQGQQFQQLFVACFEKSSPANKLRQTAGFQRMEKDWRNVLDLKGADQDRKRVEMRERWMKLLRGWKDDWCRVLVHVYDNAYNVGGTKNPILVPGESPLTQLLVNLYSNSVECLLNLSLTIEERQELRRLDIEDWKKLDPVKRRRETKARESWVQSASWNGYRRNRERTLSQQKWLQALANGSGERDRWLLALHAAASKLGSARNPVLVYAEPPLTQLLLDRYADYLEIVLDLSVSGGFTTAQREVLKDYLAKDWKKMDAAARKDFVRELEQWSEATARGSDELSKWCKALQPKVLTELHIAADNPRSKWLLETYQNERQLVQRIREQMLRDYDTKMSIYRKVGEIGDADGHFEYNPNTGRYDRWVPNR
jgi:hypothetical protein